MFNFDCVIRRQESIYHRNGKVANEVEHGMASPKWKYQQEERKEKIGDEQESNTKNSILNPRYVGY